MFHQPGCHWVMSYLVCVRGVVLFVGFVMHVVVGVPSWEGVSCRVGIVCVSGLHAVAICSAVFCMICNFSMFVEYVMNDHMVEVWVV